MIKLLDKLYWFKDFVDQDHREEFIKILETLRSLILKND